MEVYLSFGNFLSVQMCLENIFESTFFFGISIALGKYFRVKNFFATSLALGKSFRVKKKIFESSLLLRKTFQSSLSIRKYLEIKQNSHLTSRPLHPSRRRKQRLTRDPACVNRFSVRYITKTFVTNCVFANVLEASLGGGVAFTCKEKEKDFHMKIKLRIWVRGKKRARGRGGGED